MKYTISREGPDGFQPTGEIFDTSSITTDEILDEEANTLAQSYIEGLQQRNGGCYSAEIVRE